MTAVTNRCVDELEYKLSWKNHLNVCRQV